MMMMIDAQMRAHQDTIEACIDEIQNYVYTACIIVTDTLSSGNKVLLFGNGGSAADAQHIAAELTGRYKTERRGLPAIALTTDTSALTAIANDYGYERVFDRQVEALANKGDLLIGISTSGNSKNVINALKLGRELGCRTIGLTGVGGGNISQVADLNIIVPSDDTPRVQEMHIMIGHIICQAVDEVIK